MSNDPSRPPGFLSQFQPPIFDPRLRTTSQLEPNVYCDYVAEVRYFKVEDGWYGKKPRAVMVLTDYTEHPLLPYQEAKGRPIGQASIITTLWDEHCQTAQRFGIKAGDLVYLKNLRPKLGPNGTIELNMNGHRGNGYPQVKPIQKLDQNDPFVGELRIRKSKYELHVNMQNGASSELLPEPQPTLPLRSINQEHGNITGLSPPQRYFPPTPSPPPPPKVRAKLPPLPHPLHLPIYPKSYVDASPSTTSANSATTRTTPAPQDIQPVVNTPLEREVSVASTRESSVASSRESSVTSTRESSVTSTRESSSFVAVKVEPGCQDSPPTTSSASAQSRSATTSAKISPTIVLVEKVRQAARANYAEGPRFVKLRARVVGFAPQTLLDFSWAVCSNCRHKYSPISEEKPPRWCPGCDIYDRVKFEYGFRLILMDELDQTYTVDVDDEHGATLIGFPADDLLRGDDLLEKLIQRLALIGVSNVMDQDEEIYLDFCVRQNLTRSESRKETMGASLKRTGSPLPSREVKRRSNDSQGAGQSEWNKSPPSPTEEEETGTSSLTWSLVYTEILKTDWD
ncbi:hypothetical protein BG015_010008 [Linnemannia schmuckeri]|uniref:Protection of telomeres protein 1 ssDNA-binding domain-containing protein n=1 Tax=Linnemannia schmuckeri TaxID=64567 RepID=A0A9P5RY42_9FUNG|nr:hypothetical protein BG015_010008 [Linnemannia schmuckeri]